MACRLSRWLRQGSPAQAEALGLFHAYDQGERGVIATEEARPAHSLPQLNMRLCAMAPRSLKMCVLTRCRRTALRREQAGENWAEIAC